MPSRNPRRDMTSLLLSLPADIGDAVRDPILKPGATRDTLAQTAAKLGVTFPPDYAAFMVETNGAELYLGESCVIIYGVEELIGYNEPDDEFPAYFKVFGSNGGSEKLAFDVRAQPHAIVVVPHYQPSDADAIVQGTTLHAFLDRVRRDVAFE
jgi:cell wall assembly regulator SMI1